MRHYHYYDNAQHLISTRAGVYLVHSRTFNLFRPTRSGRPSAEEVGMVLSLARTPTP